MSIIISAELLQELQYGQNNSIGWQNVSRQEPKANQLYRFKWPDSEEVVCGRYDTDADGFMVVKKPTYGGDYKMLFFNSDGSMGEMCGNGARCICRYGYENGLAGEVQKVETTAGLVTGWRVDRRLYRVRLNDPCSMRLDGKAEFRQTVVMITHNNDIARLADRIVRIEDGKIVE